MTKKKKILDYVSYILVIPWYGIVWSADWIKQNNMEDLVIV